MKLISAPMATLSHEAFRRLIEGFGGCDEYFTEMINAGSLLTMGPFEKFYIISECAPEKTVWQLTGNKTEAMIKASAVLARLSGVGIDLNMGCSAPQIANTGAGIAWMEKPIEETASLVRGIRAQIDKTADEEGLARKRLSVKMRLGGEDWSEKSLLDFSKMLESEGVELITLHPRSKKEKYRAKPRYEMAEFLCQNLSIPIYLNGDIADAESAKYALSKAPSVSGLMIARAAAQKPWIFAEVQAGLQNKDESAKTKIDLYETAMKFIDDVEKYQPKEFHKTRLQRFFTYYCHNFAFWHFAQTKLLNASDNDAVRAELGAYFDAQPSDRYIEVAM